MEEFQQGLRDLGYVEGRNIAIERRYSEGRNDRLPDLAAALVRLKVDIIVTFETPAVQAARNVSSTIPIVFAVADDPVRSGLVASLARPGGNITGLATLALELSGKRLELLKEVVPGVSRVAFLVNPANSTGVTLAIIGCSSV
ncbi:MAG: ABC transporter substrate-binding protein [candidate division NC10 bacterium]